MSDIVKTMRDSLETLIGTTLPTWSLLDNKYNLEKNNYANQEKRFGVIVGSGDQAVSVTKHYTVNRSFNIILCNQYESMHNEDGILNIALDEIEDAMDEIIKASMRNKLGVPNTVLNVINGSIDEYDLDTIENVAILQFEMIVTYRAPIAQ